MKKITYFGDMIRRNHIHRLILEHWRGNKQRKAKNVVVDKFHRMEGNELRRTRGTGSRSGAMEDHGSQPHQRRRHLMIMMKGYSLAYRVKFSFCFIASNYFLWNYFLGIKQLAA